ncbi:unnamed protein product [Rotaria magnacalcarata]|uniref:Innexin n=2 Tax=Rotaria magnacalcarata TaxID=392030 RepID=A0A815EYL5_9BILA|nr:unnamed protein product [Rotaria magnacalcarata]CAF4127600.1 unnamed protein product [Rotaria magnacalcarata]
MTNIKELACHIQITRHYHRLHWTFDEDLQRRLSHLKLSKCFIQFHRKFWYQNRYFIPLMYIFIKIYYIMSILAIFFLLEYCLGFKYVFLGLPIIGKIKSKNTSALLDESFFPQRTWCLISRQKLGGIDETWADCVLPINVLNNTVFSLLWFWLIFILLMSICGLFQTLYNMLPFSARSFLGHHLRAHDLYDMKDNAVVHDFICKCPPDIILMLRLYEVELGNTLTGQVIGQLFMAFKKNYVSREDSVAIELP